MRAQENSRISLQEKVPGLTDKRLSAGTTSNKNKPKNTGLRKNTGNTNYGKGEEG